MGAGGGNPAGISMGFQFIVATSLLADILHGLAFSRKTDSLKASRPSVHVRAGPRCLQRDLGKTVMANLDDHDLAISTASDLAAEHYRASVTLLLAIVGDMFAPDRTLATRPISFFVVGMAAGILPAGIITQRYGRRAAFLAGTGCGVLVGLLAAIAVVLGPFWLFRLGTFFAGACAAVVHSFRFAAAACVEPQRRGRTLSLVMAGGVVGPQLLTAATDLSPPHVFAATCITQAAVAVLSAPVLIGVRLPTRPLVFAFTAPAMRKKPIGYQAAV
jgi:MFS family permease